MIETAVAFIKPEFLLRNTEIFDYFDSELGGAVGNFERTLSQFIQPSESFLAEHYSHVKVGYPEIYKDTVRSFSKGLIAFRIYSGPEGMVGAARKIRGPTNPLEATPSQITGRFYIGELDDLSKARAAGRAVRNVMHLSGNPEEGLRETLRFLPFLKGNALYLPYKSA